MSRYRKNSTKKTTGFRSQLPRTVATLRPLAPPKVPTLAAKFGLSDMAIANPHDPQTQSIEQEYQAYVTANPCSTDIMKFWEVRIYNDIDKYSRINTLLTSQANEDTFPTLFEIAMDYLPIQATSVPSERIFSSSSETDTKKRNRIHPVLMEALQMLKCALKNDRLDFMAGRHTLASTLCEDEPDVADLLSKLLGEGDTEAVLDEIIRNFGEDDNSP